MNIGEDRLGSAIPDRLKILLEDHLSLWDDGSRGLLPRLRNTDYENESFELLAGKAEDGLEVTTAPIRETWEEVPVEIHGKMWKWQALYTESPTSSEFYCSRPHPLWAGTIANAKLDLFDD